MPQVIAESQIVSEKMRSLLSSSINEIVTEVSERLREADIAVPVHLIIPTSGPLLHLMTPDNPDDVTWVQVIETVRSIAGRHLNVDLSGSEPMACAMAPA